MFDDVNYEVAHWMGVSYLSRFISTLCEKKREYKNFLMLISLLQDRCKIALITRITVNKKKIKYILKGIMLNYHFCLITFWKECKTNF